MDRNVRSPAPSQLPFPITLAGQWQLTAGRRLMDELHVRSARSTSGAAKPLWHLAKVLRPTSSPEKMPDCVRSKDRRVAATAGELDRSPAGAGVEQLPQRIHNLAHRQSRIGLPVFYICSNSCASGTQRQPGTATADRAEKTAGRARAVPRAGLAAGPCKAADRRGPYCSRPLSTPAEAAASVPSGRLPAPHRRRSTRSD